MDSRDYSTRDNGLFAASEQLPCDDMVTWCGTAVRSNGVEVSFNKSNWKKMTMQHQTVELGLIKISLSVKLSL